MSKYDVSIWNELSGIPFKQYFVDANGVSTRIVEAGEGEPLIMLHGIGGHIEAYARNIKSLSNHFRVIVMDMLGHGYTGKPDYPYTLNEYSDHLLAVIKALSIDDVHLSGESLGGWLSAWFAARHPQYVKTLLLNTPGNIKGKRDVMKKLKESTLKAVLEANYDTVRTRLEFLFYDTNFVTEELVESRYKIYTQPEFKQAVHNIVVLQDWEVRKNFMWEPEWTHKITAPTIILMSDHDPTATIEDAEYLQQLIPNSKLQIINDAGHWPQWEKHEEFNEIQIEFAKGVNV
ncbi:2-hydroxy-6-oxonona-2,4-dienedioate hydrolase [Neobacillus niacini]|uniref:alpha/beta fold hydrolase n=1 Tax=Neobacillus niacini TaxID=86668 RepID=UPI0027894992|nr:alpha/beta hydrolase [Neobacillus niacini]MDQ1005202.1 2-hydroxy-6-oxonona-2,4-dienedioate hydrolase [Neobacillus niacini]